MKKRPISVMILGVLMLVTGIGGLGYHVYKAASWRPFPEDLVLVCALSIVAAVCGVFLLLGSNWARWLTLAWMAFHVGVSALHSVQQTVVHGLLLAAFAYILFRRPAREYFSAGT
jgi:hypothetical protein